MGWPVSLIKQLTTVSEFDKWAAYFNMRRESPDKPDWYSAATIRAIFHAMTGKSGSVEDYLLEFKSKPKVEADPKLTSQDIWMGMFGVDRDDPSTWGTTE